MHALIVALALAAPAYAGNDRDDKPERPRDEKPSGEKPSSEPRGNTQSRPSTSSSSSSSSSTSRPATVGTAPPPQVRPPTPPVVETRPPTWDPPVSRPSVPSAPPVVGTRPPTWEPPVTRPPGDAPSVGTRPSFPPVVGERPPVVEARPPTPPVVGTRPPVVVQPHEPPPVVGIRPPVVVEPPEPPPVVGTRPPVVVQPHDPPPVVGTRPPVVADPPSWSGPTVRPPPGVIDPPRADPPRADPPTRPDDARPSDDPWSVGWGYVRPRHVHDWHCAGHGWRHYDVHYHSSTYAYGYSRPFYANAPAHYEEAETRWEGVDRGGTLAVGLRAATLSSGYLASGGGVAEGYTDPGAGLLVRWRPDEAVGLELDLMRYIGDIGADPSRKQNLAQGSVEVFAWPEGRVQPYGLVGMTRNGRELDDTYVDGAETRVAHVDDVAWGPHAGLGVEIAVGQKWAIDIEGRAIGWLEHDASDPTLPGALQATATALVHF